MYGLNWSQQHQKPVLVKTPLSCLRTVSVTYYSVVKTPNATPGVVGYIKNLVQG